MITIKKMMYFALAMSCACQIFAQVTISPTSLFIDSQRRFETLLIMNTSAQAQEVKLSFEFAYPRSDETGNLDMIYDDPEQEALHSAAGWIRGFPKSFILEPGARQVVRITAKTPSSLAPGTYWSRLKTTSNTLSPPVGTVEEGTIGAQINVKFNQITSIFVKHGNLTTGLEMQGLQHKVQDQQLQVLASFTKSGNSPFLGSMVGKIYDASGALVKEGRVFVSIYYDGLRKLEIDIGDLPAGSYKTEISFASERADISDSHIIPGPTVTAQGGFTKL